jgi:integrase
LTTMTSDKNNVLFNQEAKEAFLKGIKEGTRQSYERIFRITNAFEVALNKDVSNFTLEEIETILYDFKANNRNTIESYARIISSYLNWAVIMGLTKENVLGDFKPEDFERYLTNEEMYLSDRKLRRYEDRCTNFQDAVILRLIFAGIGGRQLSEIRNLKKSDVNFETGQLRLIETLKADEHGNPVKFTERYLTVDDRTLNMIEGAIDQKQYTKRNGFMVERDNIRSFTDLVSNEYVVRSSITKTDNFNYPVDKFVLYRRIQTVSKTLNIDLTAKFIQRSGIMFYANSLIKDDELSLDDLKMVADRFNMKSYHNLKGFLTLDNIRTTYPKK